MRTLHIDCGLPVSKWLDVLKATEYLMNRTPTKTNEQLKTPYEIVNGTKPDMSNIRIFGTAAMVHIPVQRRQAAATKGPGKDKIELGERAKEKIMVGYNETGYSFLDIETNTTEVSRNVTRWFEHRTYHDVINQPRRYSELTHYYGGRTTC